MRRIGLAFVLALGLTLAPVTTAAQQAANVPPSSAIFITVNSHHRPRPAGDLRFVWTRWLGNDPSTGRGL